MGTTYLLEWQYSSPPYPKDYLSLGCNKAVASEAERLPASVLEASVPLQLNSSDLIASPLAGIMIESIRNRIWPFLKAEVVR